MTPFIISIVLLLLAGFWVARGRSGWQRIVIIASVPIGALVGGYCGSELCYLFLRQQGGGESHNDMVPIAAAGMAGFAAGAIALPITVFFLTGRQKKDDQPV